MTDSNLLFYAIIFIAAFAITIATVKKLIPMLSRSAKQPIFEEGPSWHMKKKGTPTMGGISFIVAAVPALSLACISLFSSGESYFDKSLLITLIYSVLNALVGIIDDRTKLKRHENAGLTPKEKLLLQVVLAVGFLLSRSIILGDGSKIYFSFGSVELGFLYYPLAIIALLASVNCANLTDGVDGLASGVCFAIGLSLFYISYSASSDTAFISIALVGISLGFLFFNIHPAKIFMGDTGSLFFGAAIGAAAIALGNFLLLLFIGIVYFIEGLSVMIQVAIYKLTGKRVFKMAPIHHHLEKCGWSENKIVLSAIFLTLIVSIPAYVLFV